MIEDSWEDVRREAGFVDAVVDVVVDPFVHFVDLLLVLLGEEIDMFVLLLHEVVECVVEHADDLGGLVVDYSLLLLIVQRRDSEATLIVGVLLEVDVAEVDIVRMERIWCHVLARYIVFCSCKAPSYSL